MPAKMAPRGGGINRSGSGLGTLAEHQTHSRSCQVEIQPEGPRWRWRPAKPTLPHQTQAPPIPHGPYPITGVSGQPCQPPLKSKEQLIKTAGQGGSQGPPRRSQVGRGGYRRVGIQGEAWTRGCHLRGGRVRALGSWVWVTVSSTCGFGSSKPPLSGPQFISNTGCGGRWVLFKKSSGVERGIQRLGPVRPRGRRS